MLVTRPTQALPATFPRLSLLTLLLTPLILCGCGGGGGGGGGSKNSTVQPKTDTPAVLNPSSPATASKVKVGIVDSGLAPGRSEFNYANVHFSSWLSGGSSVLNDNMGSSGHGTLVALTLAGLASGSFRGGVAPDVDLWVAQASSNNLFYYSDTSQAIRYLLNNGVRIINMSYDSSERLTSNSDIQAARNNGSYQTLRDSLQDIVNAGALGVVPTGNGNTATPAPNAQIPLIFNNSTLAHGLIAVTGVVPGQTTSSGDRPAELYVFDACGNAAAWCMAAAGYVDYQDTDGSQWRAFGTSFAAPRVAGAAARVSAVFPWMNGYNLQQTLLTTATYHSDAGARLYTTTVNGSQQTVFTTGVDTANGRPYNDTFGWGDLNLTKALKGPGMFYGDDFTAALTAGDYTFANNISGNGGLIVSGDNGAGGVLHLTGNNSYSGDTRVLSNSLAIDGAVTSNVQVSGSGLLYGAGRVGGSVSNSGNVATTTAGGLQINGNYAQTAAGTLHVTLSQPLNVAGTASLNGALTVAPPSTQYVVQSHETLLQSAGGVSGSFARVDPGVFLSGNVSYGSNSVTGNFQRVNTLQAAQAAGIQSESTLRTAANLENAFRVADSQAAQGSASASAVQQSALQTGLAAVQQIGSAAAAESVLNSLSGQAHASNNALLFSSLDYQSQLLDNRLSPLPQDKPFGFWAETGTLRGDMQQDGYMGSHYRIQTTAIGSDSNFDIPGLRLGFAFTDSQLKSRYDGSGGNGNDRLQGVMLYSRYMLTPAWYLQGNLNYQHGRSELNRVLLVDGVQASSATSKSDGWQGLLKTGYRWSLTDSVGIEPYAGIKYSQLQTGSFEDSGGALGLSGNGDSYSRTVGLSGLRLSSTLFEVDRWWSMLSLYGEYQYAFNNPSMDVTARWNGSNDSAASFDIPGMALDRDSAWYGLRLDAGRDRDVRLFMRLDRHVADRGDESVLRGGIDIAF